jgi:adenylosuccinate synthase
MIGCAHIIVDPLYGDSGKGKIAARLAARVDAAVAIEVGSGPSAGHEIVDAEGRAFVTRMIPSCFTQRRTLLAIAKDILIEPTLLQQELAALAPYDADHRLRVDARCRVADFCDARDLVAAEAAIRRGERADGVGSVADVCWLHSHLVDVDALGGETLHGGADIVVIVQHGTCVGRDYGEGEVVDCACTATMPAVADVAANGRRRVVLVVKAMPTRSLRGVLPHETAWPARLPRAVGKSSGRPFRIAAAPDLDLLQAMARVNEGHEVCLTFADVLDPAAAGITSWNELPRCVRQLIDRIEAHLGLPVTYVSTGPRLDDGVERPAAL